MACERRDALLPRARDDSSVKGKVRNNFSRSRGEADNSIIRNEWWLGLTNSTASRRARAGQALNAEHGSKRKRTRSAIGAALPRYFSRALADWIMVFERCCFGHCRPIRGQQTSRFQRRVSTLFNPLALPPFPLFPPRCSRVPVDAHKHATPLINEYRPENQCGLGQCPRRIRVSPVTELRICLRSFSMTVSSYLDGKVTFHGTL